MITDRIGIIVDIEHDGSAAPMELIKAMSLFFSQDFYVQFTTEDGLESRLAFKRAHQVARILEPK